jgi:hypothetical protein
MNFNLNYEPSKKNIIRTLAGLFIIHYFIFFQRYDHFFSFIIFDFNKFEYTRFGNFLDINTRISSKELHFIQPVTSFSLLFFYWNFRKKVTCFFEELIKKFIQKV